MQEAWESLNTQIGSNNNLNVSDRTMATSELVKTLTQINLDSQYHENMTQGPI